MDRIQKRLEVAKSLGADEIINIDSDHAELTNIAEVVFETAGSPKATQSLFKYAKPGGCVVQVGWPTGNIVDMNIAKFIEKELDYVAVNRCSNTYPAAINYISGNKIDVKKIITHRFSFEEVAAAFDFAHKNKNDAIKVVVLM
jgi:L-iditol 2-dehydrogenase